MPYDPGPQIVTIRDHLVAWGPRIVAAIVILIVVHFLARAVKWAILRMARRVSVMQRETAARPGETIGGQIAALAYWLVWLIGLVVALQPLGLAQALTPIRAMTSEVLVYLPRIVAAGLIFFVGVLIARLVRNIAETALAVADIDGWLTKAGLGDVASDASDGPARRGRISRTIGAIVFTLIVIPVAIAALQALGISSISDPAVLVLQTVLNAIPRVVAAAILLAIAWFIGRWVRGLVEQILPSLGFDRALASLGGFTPTTQPSRIVGAVVFAAIILFFAIEAMALLDFDAVSLMLMQVTELGSRVVFGSAIIVVGVLMARIVTNLVGQSVGESGLPSILKYAIIALAVAIGLRFMGLANEIVNLAFGLILGSAAVAVALAFGLGGRATAHKLLERWTGRLPAAPPAPGQPEPPDPRLG